MKKRIVCVVTSILLVGSNLVGCFSKPTVETDVIKDEIVEPVEVVEEETNEREQDNQKVEEINEKPEVEIEQPKMVELTEEIKNSLISDDIIQIGNQIVKLDGSVTYSELIEICNNELKDLQLTFHDQSLNVNYENDVYCDINGIESIEIRIINPNYPEMIEAKDCAVVDFHERAEGQIVYDLNQNIIFAGNINPLRTDCTLMENSITTEEEVRKLLPEDSNWIWIDDYSTVGGRCSYYKIIHPNNQSVLIHATVGVNKNNDDGKLYLSGFYRNAEFCGGGYNDMEPGALAVYFAGAEDLNYLESIIAIDRKEHPECY